MITEEEMQSKMDKIQDLENQCAKLALFVGILTTIIDKLLDRSLKNRSKAEIWIKEATHQVIYLNKPIPKLPRGIF